VTTSEILDPNYLRPTEVRLEIGPTVQVSPLCSLVVGSRQPCVERDERGPAGEGELEVGGVASAQVPLAGDNRQAVLIRERM
jgi:hypothetical protein